MPTAAIGHADLHYETHGDGHPVLGIIGFAIDQRFWAAQIPAIAAASTFITFDNRGIGRSTGTPPESIEEMAADSVALLDHLGVDKAVVFGVSMGGAIAQRVALDHPDRVEALILGFTFARPIEYMRREREVTKDLVDKVGLETLVDASLLHLFSPRFFEVGQETIDRMVRSFFAESGPDPAGDAAIRAQLEAIGNHDVLERLGQIRCPTLVIGARYDMMVPFFASEEIAGAIPQARLEAVDAGHAALVEAMDEVNGMVTSFLQEVRQN